MKMKPQQRHLDPPRSLSPAEPGADGRTAIHLALGIALLALASLAETRVYQASNHVTVLSLVVVTLLVLIAVARSFVPARVTVRSVRPRALADDARGRESDVVLLRAETTFRQPPIH